MFRPADANETAVGWRVALERRHPTALVLTRQALPVLDPDAARPAEVAARGGYVLEGDDDPQVILIATGSEVHVALDARGPAAERGVRAGSSRCPPGSCSRSSPRATATRCCRPSVDARVAVEAAAPLGWERYAGPHGAIVALDRFGASAPGATVLRQPGIHRPSAWPTRPSAC